MLDVYNANRSLKNQLRAHARELSPWGFRSALRENDCRVGVAHVPRGALSSVGRGSLHEQWIPRTDPRRSRRVFCPASVRAPSAIGDSNLGGHLQRCPIDTRLPTAANANDEKETATHQRQPRRCSSPSHCRTPMKWIVRMPNRAAASRFAIVSSMKTVSEARRPCVSSKCV